MPKSTSDAIAKKRAKNIITQMQEKAEIKAEISIDKNGIYYQNNFFSIDTNGFKIIGSDLIIDKKEIVPIWRTLQKAYIGNKEIAISSPATFENIYYDYLKDEHHLYYINNGKVTIVPDADLASIRKDLATENYISDKSI